MKRVIIVCGVLAIVLLTVSVPACYFGERAAQQELGKLSPAERELRQFDIEYVRLVLPGIALVLSGLLSGVVAIALWVVELVSARREAGASR
ncbi:MAG TPA: hypothetical protein VF064_13120 [Pyrinomonadaceae bacterium]